MRYFTLGLSDGLLLRSQEPSKDTEILPEHCFKFIVHAFLFCIQLAPSVLHTQLCYDTV